MRSRTIVFTGLFTSIAIVAMAQDSGSNNLVRTSDAVTDYVDAGGRPTTVVTDAFGQLVSGTDATGLTTTINRDNRGNPLNTTLPSGAIIDRTYDSIGNLTSITDRVLGGTTTVSYETVFNQIESVTDPLLGQTTAVYDSQGNPAQLTSPMGRVANAGYNGNGLLETLTDTLGVTATVVYDADRLPATVSVGTGPEMRTVQITYTAEGYQDTRTDAEGRTTDFDYDSMGRLVLATLPDSREIGFGYDPAGNLNAVTPPGREAYLFDYDDIGLLAVKRYPEVVGGGSNQTSYAYDDARQLTTITRADGVVVNYVYDTAGRVQQIVQPNGSYVFNYDSMTGLLQSIVSPDGVTQTFSYNNDLINQVAWSGPVAGSVGYTFDSKGRLTTLSISGSDLSYVYNADDEVIQAGVMALSYGATTGLLMSRTLGDLTENFGYNTFGELVSHTVDSSSATLYNTQYSRDRLSRITQKIEVIAGTTATTDYSYDLAGRLATVTVDGAAVTTYNYDDNGNRIDNAALHDAQDRITSQATTSYIYNGHGERIRKTAGAAVTEYQYDAGGTLTGVTLPSGDQLDYLLDGDSRRVAKLLNGTRTEAWLYLNPVNPVARLDAANSVTQRYIYAPGNDNVPAYLVDGASEYLLIADHLGSVRMVVDSNDGSIMQLITYDAWGQITGDSNPGFQPFAFAGGHFDNDSSLHHFGYREYDAESSVWTSKDPSGFGGSPNNLYSYVNADPINNIDPFGLQSSDGRGETVAFIDSIDGTGQAFIRLAGGKLYRPASVGDKLCVGDRVKTDNDTMVSTRFSLGGRANLDRGGEFQITSDRDAKLLKSPIIARPLLADFLNFFGAGAISDPNVGKPQVLIQTAGGVLGTTERGLAHAYNSQRRSARKGRR